MTAKEQLLQEIDRAPEELIEALLTFLRSIKPHLNHQSPSQAVASTPVTTPVEEVNHSLLDLFNEFDRFTENIPAEELANLPSDSAEQHDHYLYGTAKKPA